MYVYIVIRLSSFLFNLLDLKHWVHFLELMSDHILLPDEVAKVVGVSIPDLESIVPDRYGLMYFHGSVREKKRTVM